MYAAMFRTTLTKGNFLVARPSWPCFHSKGRLMAGLQARAILGNYRIIYMAKHIR